MKMQSDPNKIELGSNDDSDIDEEYYTQHNFLIEEKPENEEKSTIKAGLSDGDVASNATPIKKEESKAIVKVLIQWA